MALAQEGTYNRDGADMPMKAPPYSANVATSPSSGYSSMPPATPNDVTSRDARAVQFSPPAKPNRTTSHLNMLWPSKLQ